MYTIITLVMFPNGTRYYTETETSLKSTFDYIVGAVFDSKFDKATWLIDSKGKLIDSYIKE